MTGPEHYREAERLVDQAHHFAYGDGGDTAVGAALAAEAQVHATLAQVAATVDATGPEMKSTAATAWEKGISPRPRGRRNRREIDAEGGEPR